jgi:glycerol transport system ATP-binding protein
VAGGVQLPGGTVLALNLPTDLPAGAQRSAGSALTLGIRASALRVRRREGDVALPGTVELAEIAGSDTFVHVATAIGELVAQLTGVHVFEIGSGILLYLNPSDSHAFDAAGRLLLAPSREGA